MTELEQLRADLATLEKALNVQGTDRGFNQFTRMEIVKVQDKIADLYEPQEQVDPWKRAKEALFQWDQNDREPDHITKRSIFAYIQNLQAKVDLNVATIRNLRTVEQNREKLAELNTILNAIPPACGLARELVQKRIDGVKREMQE